MASQDIKLSPAGLWTAPAVLEAPPGGLLRAEEIVLRRSGMAEPRPGFQRSTDLTAEPVRFGLIPFKDNFLRITQATPLTTFKNATCVVKDEAGADIPWLADAMYGVESRKNLYITTSDVLRKLDAVNVIPSSTSVAYQAGAPVPAATGVKTSGSAGVVALSYVGYRVLTKRTDANKLIVRSGVSGRAVIFNGTASDQKVNVTVVLNPEDDFRVGDTIEIYRSFNSLVVPPDEEYLVNSTEIDSTILSAGGFLFGDEVPDAQLGAALYTNESRGGIQENHIRPPAASYVELFNGSLFLSDLAFPAEQIISWTSNISAGATGVGSRSLTGTFTNGSADITSVSSTTGLQVGQIIQNSASEYASNTQYVRITAIVSNTVTVSSAYAGSTGSKVRGVYDSIRVGSLYFPASTAYVFVLSLRGYDAGGINPGGHSVAVDVTANWLGDLYPDNTPNVSNLQFVQIQTVKPSITAPLIYATHGDQYTPILPLPTATGFTMPKELQPAGIMWSNNLAPEHFTLDNIDLLGGADSRIMAMRAMRNALLAFKEDGLWRVSGAGAESGFRFDALDPNVQLLFSAATAPVGNKVYAWCDLGVYECDENGCLDVSNPAIQDSLEPLQRLIKTGSRIAYGAWAMSNRKDGEFMLSVPTTSDLTKGERLYVFNQSTGSWVNWFIGHSLHAGMYRNNDELIVCSGQYLLGERVISAGDTYHADQAFSVTISGVSGGTVVTISGGSGWTPVVGDMLVKSSVTYMVTAVTSSTVFTVHTTITSGSAIAYVAYTSAIQWIANTAKNPGLLKSWGEGSIWWNSLYGMLRYDTSFTSSLSSTAVSQTKAITTRAVTNVPEAYRFTVPRNHARTTRLYPLVTVRQAGSAWGIEAISLGYMYMSDRVRTR